MATVFCTKHIDDHGEIGLASMDSDLLKLENEKRKENLEV